MGLLARRLPWILAILLLSLTLAASVAVAASAAPGGAQAAQAGDDEEQSGDEELEGEEELLGDEESLDDEAVEEDDSDALAPIEQATAELGRAKRAAAGKVGRRSATTLRQCMRSGPGWKRIRAVEHGPQRALYTASARKLLADMRLLLDVQQPRIEAYAPAFGRYVDRLRAVGVSDPLLVEAVAAQGRRLAAHRDVHTIVANCQVFNRLTGAVREFRTRSAADIVRVDYRATPVARRIQRHVSNQLAAIDRRHKVSYRDAETLEDAAKQMVAAGGSPGAALGFQYALSLR